MSTWRWCISHSLDPIQNEVIRKRLQASTFFLVSLNNHPNSSFTGLQWPTPVSIPLSTIGWTQGQRMTINYSDEVTIRLSRFRAYFDQVLCCVPTYMKRAATVGRLVLHQSPGLSGIMNFQSQDFQDWISLNSSIFRDGIGPKFWSRNHTSQRSLKITFSANKLGQYHTFWTIGDKGSTKKHRKNCESCPTQVTWKIKF